MGEYYLNLKKKFKKIFFLPLGPLLQKNSKFWLFLWKKIGGMWHMFYGSFLKPFSYLNLFFSKFWFFGPQGAFKKMLGPLFWKNSNFWVFWRNFLCVMWHMFYRCFLKPFSYLNLFFQNFIFFGLRGTLKKN